MDIHDRLLHVLCVVEGGISVFEYLANTNMPLGTRVLFMSDAVAVSSLRPECSRFLVDLGLGDRGGG
jgi:hypothetical protein